MKELTDTDFKKIIARRDRRYDGRFYFGVKTTKIYCRPVCPARPKPENILIFRSLSEAENAGYRPCLRCHPDVAPGSRFLEGTSNTVARALRLIDGSVERDQDLDVENLAASLGLTARHLRRLFDEHLGASPIEIMITKRLHLARQLISETARPITEIAFAVGFQSVRRFNEAFQELYRRSPSELRKNLLASPVDELVLRLPIREPYDWPTVMSYLARHEAFGIEQVSADSYRRFLPLGKSFGTLTVTKEESFLKVRLQNLPLTEVRSVLARLKSLFDTEHNPEHLPKKNSGIRVPGAFDTFEIAVSIVLSQLISTAQAQQKLKSLIVRFGRPLSDTVYAFPQASVLQKAPLEEIGLTRTKAGAIRELAAQVANGKLPLSAAADPQVVVPQLLAIRGIGPWTTSMIEMRCLGSADAFPERDLIVLRAIEAGLVDPAEWTSSRAYLTHILWRDYSVTLSKTKRGRK